MTVRDTETIVRKLLEPKVEKPKSWYAGMIIPSVKSANKTPLSKLSIESICCSSVEVLQALITHEINSSEKSFLVILFLFILNKDTQR